MKIVAVLGSPRLNGNSAFITERFLDSARELGAEVQSYALNTLSYRGCQACMGCKGRSEVCVLKDDLTDVLEAVREADVLILSSPVYYADITAQLKLFIDRTYSFLRADYRTNQDRSRLAPGKTMVFVQTQGMADEAFFTDIFPRYSWAMKFNGFENVHWLRCCGVSNRDDAQQRADVLAQAEELARCIVNAN